MTTEGGVELEPPLKPKHGADSLDIPTVLWVVGIHRGHEVGRKRGECEKNGRHEGEVSDRRRALSHPWGDCKGGLAKGEVGLHGSREVPRGKVDDLLLQVVGVGEASQGRGGGQSDTNSGRDVQLGAGSRAEAQEKHRDNSYHGAHEGGPHVGSRHCNREDSGESNQALQDALGHNVVVEGKDDHAQKPAKGVGPRGDETVVNLRGRKDVVVASLVLDGVECRPGEDGVDDNEDLGDDGSEPKET